MTTAEREELDRQDRKRRREEAAILALLLLFLDKARFAVPHAMRLGTDPIRAAGEAITGGGIHQPGIVNRLAVRLATTHQEAAQAAQRATGATSGSGTPHGGGVSPVRGGAAGDVAGRSNGGGTGQGLATPAGVTTPGPTTTAGARLLSPAAPPAPAGTPAEVRQLAQQYRVVATEAADRLAGNVRQLVGTVLQTVHAAEVAPTLATIIRTMKEGFAARGYASKSAGAAKNTAITLAASAWSAGAWSAWARPEVWTQIQAFRFVTFHDSDGKPDERVCPICKPLDGVTLPRDDPWWLGHWSPLHHVCRCVVWPVFGPFRVKQPPEGGKPPGANFGARPDLRPGYTAFNTR